MINYTNPNTPGMASQIPQNYMMQQPQTNQFPYGNNNMLLNYDYSRMNGNFQNQNQFLKCRPVSSKDEAKAFQIDLDGSLWVFTDVGNGKIYTKQINNDGTAAFKTYSFVEDENSYNSTDYVTKEEFNKVIQSLMAVIQNNGSQGLAATKDNPQKPTLMNF